MGFKRRLANNKLRKLAKNQHRDVSLPDPDQVKTVGIIWQPSQKEAFQYLKTHFNKTQTIFRSFCVFEEDIDPLPDNNTLTKNDLDWLGLPKKEKVEDFLGIQFDLLICLSNYEGVVLDYFLLNTSSKFIVGSSPSTENHFDLNIKIEENHDALYLAKQQIFYLAQLNKNRIK